MSDDEREIPLSRAGVEEAYQALREHLFETPLLPSPELSSRTDARVLLKPENIQRAGSFKVRGSVNKIRKLAAETDLEEVTAASAGNHAQGVAYASALLGIRSTIFMPQDAPIAKKRATERFGGDVRMEGRNYEEARAASLEYAASNGAVFVDGFDDWDVIEGQGTIAVEIAQELGDRTPDYVLVPAGGGGLLAGTLFYLRERYGSDTRVIGVQSERAPALTESLQRYRETGSLDGLPLSVATRPTIADGVRIGRPGDRPFDVIRRWVDDIVLVDEQSVYEGILHFYEHSRLVVEGAGAIGAAALLQGRVTPEPDATVVIVVSGGNVDAGVMEKIINAYLFRSGRRAVFRIRVKDLPGQLAHVVRVFERERINVAEIEQPPILGKPTSPEYTVFDIAVETEGREHLPQIIDALQEEQRRMAAGGEEPFEILER